jgi:hypothetical protein
MSGPRPRTGTVRISRSWWRSFRNSAGESRPTVQPTMWRTWHVRAAAAGLSMPKPSSRSLARRERDVDDLVDRRLRSAACAACHPTRVIRSISTYHVENAPGCRSGGRCTPPEDATRTRASHPGPNVRRAGDQRPRGRSGPLRAGEGDAITATRASWPRCSTEVQVGFSVTAPRHPVDRALYTSTTTARAARCTRSHRAPRAVHEAPRQPADDAGRTTPSRSRTPSPPCAAWTRSSSSRSTAARSSC